MNIAIIILAAGAATRMKNVKQLLPIADTTLLNKSINTALDVNTLGVITVLGANATTILDNGLPNNCFVTINTNWDQGMGSSIAHGVAFAIAQFEKLDGILIMLADQPNVSTNYLKEIITLFKKHNTNIIATKYVTSVGVPVLFPKHLFSALQALTGKQGAKIVLNQFKEQVLPLTPSFNNIDIDTPDDYNNYINTYS